MPNLSCENEFYLHENEKWFPYQRLSTYPSFETEARGNSKMAYSFSWGMFFGAQFRCNEKNLIPSQNGLFLVGSHLVFFKKDLFNFTLVHLKTKHFLPQHCFSFLSAEILARACLLLWVQTILLVWILLLKKNNHYSLANLLLISQRRKARTAEV